MTGVWPQILPTILAVVVAWIVLKNLEKDSLSPQDHQTILQSRLYKISNPIAWGLIVSGAIIIFISIPQVAALIGLGIYFLGAFVQVIPFVVYKKRRKDS